MSLNKKSSYDSLQYQQSPSLAPKKPDRSFVANEGNIGVADNTDNLLALTSSDNAMVSTVALALSSLTHEMDHLCQEAEKRFYGPIFYYGEGRVYFYATSFACLSKTAFVSTYDMRSHLIYKVP